MDSKPTHALIEALRNYKYDDNAPNEKMQTLGKLLYEGLDKIDESLSDYKRENKIEGRIYEKYVCGIFIQNPLYGNSGFWIASETPTEIAKQYAEAYNQAVSALK